MTVESEIGKMVVMLRWGDAVRQWVVLPNFGYDVLRQARAALKAPVANETCRGDAVQAIDRALESAQLTTDGQASELGKQHSLAELLLWARDTESWTALRHNGYVTLLHVRAALLKSTADGFSRRCAVSAIDSELKNAPAL